LEIIMTTNAFDPGTVQRLVATLRERIFGAGSPTTLRTRPRATMGKSGSPSEGRRTGPARVAGRAVLLVSTASLAAVGSLVGASAASAAPSATRVGAINGYMFVAAAAGRSNDIRVFRSSTFTIDVIDRGDRVTAGTGCRLVTGHQARCGWALNPVRRLTITAGDLNDHVTSSTGLPAVISGEAGDDVLIGGSGADVLSGGPGLNRPQGNAGNDTLIGGSSRDEMNGGDGDDRLLGGDGNDGMDGGKGNDTLHGDPAGTTSSAAQGTTGRSVRQAPTLWTETTAQTTCTAEREWTSSPAGTVGTHAVTALT
jgi:RTX calcium-binding nonapeptide repeat (4 copies)